MNTVTVTASAVLVALAVVIAFATAAPVTQDKQKPADLGITKVKESSPGKPLVIATAAQKDDHPPVVASPAAAQVHHVVAPLASPVESLLSAVPSAAHVLPLTAEAMSSPAGDESEDEEDQVEGVEGGEGLSEAEEERAAEEEKAIKERENAIDEELYLQALLSDPQFINEIESQKREDNVLMYPYVDPSPADIVLTPRAMAEYLLLTGDLQGAANMINDLVAYGSLTESEARSYRLAVEAEYDLLADSESQYNRQAKREQIFSSDVGDSAVADYDTRYATSSAADGEQLSAAADYYDGRSDEQQLNEALTNNDEKLRNLLETILREEEENTLNAEKSIAEEENQREDQSLSSSFSASSRDGESGWSLEQELESLPSSRQTSADLSATYDQTGAEEEMSVEDQLAALLGSKTQTSANSYKQETANDDVQSKPISDSAAAELSALAVAAAEHKPTSPPAPATAAAPAVAAAAKA